MNIAIVSPFNPSFIRESFKNTDVPDINSNATAVNILVAALMDAGHKVYVYTTDICGPEVKSFSGKNIELRVISREFHPGFLQSFRVVKRIRKAIEKDIKDIDVIHSHWTYEYAAATRYFENRIPVFCTVRDWCPYQKKLVKNFRDRYYWMIVKSILFSYVMKSKSIHFIANSTYTYKMIHKDYPSKKCCIIPNPVQHKYIIDEKRSINKYPIYISICPSLDNRRKNIDTLLKAYKKLRKQYNKCELYLIGDYSKEWEIKHRNYLNGVTLIGAVAHDDVYDYLDKADILVHPSVEETFGNILLEAMARRVVCIGGNKSGAVPEVLGQGKRGFLCNVMDEESIKDAMIKATDQSIVRQMIDNATDYLKIEYSDISVALKHKKVYQRFIKSF